MRQVVQWQVEIHIDAPVAEVWNAIADLSLIPKFHPVVRRVEYLSGETKRAPGVAYKCIVPEGPRKGWCVERVVENIPNRKMSVSFTEDSWGLNRMFSDFLAETTLEATGDHGTLVRLTACYAPRRLTVRLMNALLIRSKMRKSARQTLEGLKRLVEASA